MTLPRLVTVLHARADSPETHFWFPVSEAMLVSARRAEMLAEGGHQHKRLDQSPFTVGQIA